ncbi:MAG: thioesterase, partial [Sphingobium sp.]|nr:thioesterase [Sphingobium sp.]
PARLDDDLMVVSRVAQVSAATCTIHQSVMRGDEQLTDASICVAWLTPQGRPQRQPKAWTDIFSRLCQGEDLHP